MKRDQEIERVDLRVRTKQFALRIIRLYSALPKRIEAEVIGKQALRSGTSIGANFREAHRARSDLNSCPSSAIA
jgi:four helix bundle protein